MKKAALFDLDGVIVDTETSYTKFWKEIGKRYFPYNLDFAYEIKGHTLDYIFDHYFSKDLDGQNEIQRMLLEHQSKMHYPFISGVIDFVETLRSRGVGVAVVTSSDCAKMQNLYREHPDFAQHFDRIFTAEDALRSKPAPDCYIAAAKFFGLSAFDCVVFEDSFNGLKAGGDAGAYVVGLTTTYSDEELVGCCDCVVPDFLNSKELLLLFE